MTCAICPDYHECVLHMPGVEHMALQKNRLVMFYICKRNCYKF